MSAQIDERIVEMRFENSKFEKNVSETMKTLDKLKDKLSFKKSGEGFDELQKSADKVSFEHLVKSVDALSETVKHRTGIMGGVFEELGSRIVRIWDNSLGKVQSMINQVTFDPISTGLSEYELKINSVQVIAANTGVLMRDAMKGFGKSTNKANDAVEELYETAIYGAEHYNLALDESSTITGELFKSASIAADDFQAALDVMMGNYGNGQQRKDLLGDRYADIQDTVNMLIAETGSVEGAIRELESAGYTAAGVLYEYNEAGELVANTSEMMTEAMDSVTSSFDDMDDAAEYTMEDIEKVLDALNVYADKTIYNYAQMTDAIGQFTVQGVDLYDSASAVQGLANLAAFTGVDAAGAARVMREAAKGLSTGFIGLQDWMSFETTGGMGGKIFQEQLLATADQLWKTDAAYREYAMNAAAAAAGLSGSLDDSVESISEFVSAQGKFRNSLKAGWLNDTVLIETLHKFAGDLTDAEYAARGYSEEEIADIQALGEVAFEAATKAKTFTQMWDAVTEAAQSSWTTTWEYIFGHFYDARNLWTAISDALSEIIGDFNDSRNAALKFWAKSPFGRASWLKGMARLWGFLRDVFYSVKDSLDDIMGTITGRKLVEWSIGFEKMTRALDTDKAVSHVQNLINILSVFLSVLKIGLNITTAIVKFVGKTVKTIFGLIPIDLIEAITSLIADLFISLAKMEISPDNIFGDVINIFNVLKASLTELDFGPLNIVVDLLVLFGKIIVGVGIVIGTALENILGLFGVTFDTANINGILDTADAFIQLADSMIDLESISGSVTTAMSKLFDFIKNVPMYLFAGVVTANELLKEFTGIDVLDIFGKIFNNIKSMISNSAGLLSDFFDRFGKAEGIGGKISVVLTTIGDAFKSVFSGVFDNIPLFSKIKDFIESLINENSLQRLTQLAVLAARLYLLVKVIASTKAITYIAEGIKKFVDALTEGASGTFSAATKAFKTMQKSANAQLLFSIAAALLALAVAVWVISRVPSEKMTDVLSALTLIFGGMIALLGSLKKMLGVVPESAAASIGGVMAGIAFTMLTIGLTIKMLSGIDEYDMIKAIVAIAAVIGALSFLIKAFAHTKRAKYAVQVAVGVNLLIGAIFPLVAALGWLALMVRNEKEGELTTALAILGTIALFIIGMVEFLTLAASAISTGPAVGALVAIGGTMILISIAIIIMVGALFLIMKEIQWTYTLGPKGTDVGMVAIFTLAAMMIMLSAFVAIVMTLAKTMTPSSVAGLFVIGGTMIALEVAILAMVGILALIMKIIGKATREGEVGEALNILVTTIIWFAVAMAVLMAMSNFLKPAAVAGLFVIGGAMIAMAAAVLIIVVALQKLMEIDREGADYANAVLTLGKIIAAVVLIAVILGVLFGNSKFLSNNRFAFSFNPRITGNAAGMSKVGSLLAGIGISILAVIAALWLVIDIFAKLIDLSDKWDAENGREKLTNVIVGICGAFIDAYPQIKESGEDLNNMIMDLIKALIDDIVVTIELLLIALAEIVDDLATAIVNIVISILNGIAGTDLTSYNLDAMASDAFNFESLLEAFYADAEKAPVNRLINAIVALIAIIIYGIGDALINQAGPLVAAIGHLVLGIMYISAYAFAALSGILASMFGDFDFSYLEGFMADWDNLWENWLIGTQDFWKKVENGEHQVLNFVANFFYGLANIIVVLIDAFARLGYQIAHVFTDPLGLDYEPPEWIQDFYELYGDIARGSYFFKAAAGIDDVFDSAGETVKILTDVNDTIDSMSGKNVDVTMTMGPRLVVDEDEFSMPMFDALNKAGEESKKGFKDAWDIHSPSGVGEKYGENIAEGQAIGYSNFMNSDKAKEYMDSAKQKFESMMSDIDISGMMGLDGAEIDLKPQQIFNLDTENLGGNLMTGEFGDMFSGMGTNMSDMSTTISDMGLNMGTMSTDLADVSNCDQELSDALAAEGGRFYDDSDLIDEIGSLREDIWALSDAMSKIKMQLDTGKIVGEMVAPMDAALAQRATRASRGN